jgi:hypothetical protein
MNATHALSERRFAAVSRLGADERFAHFLNRVADRETAACANHEWAGNAPASIDAHELVEEWLPAMASDHVLLAVFPTPGMRGVIVSATELAAALRQALAAYE